MTAFLADSLRCSGVIAAALAGPPFLPPFLPSRDSCSRSSLDTFAMHRVYTKPGYVVNKNNFIFLLTCVSGLRILCHVMNVLPQDKQAAIIAAHVEGNSIRSIERMTGVHRDTIMRLIVRTGQGCARLLDERIKKD